MAREEFAVGRASSQPLFSMRRPITAYVDTKDRYVEARRTRSKPRRWRSPTRFGHAVNP